MRWQSRSHAVNGTWPTVGLLATLGAVGVQAQEVVDLPAEDLPLSANLDQVYRIGSAVAQSEWEQFTAVQHIGFDGAGNLYILDAPGPEAGTRVVIVDPAGRHVKDFGRQGEGPGEFQWPRRMVVWADGRTLVEDVLHMGSHVFGPEGDFERIVRGAVGPNLRPDPVDASTVVGVSWRREDQGRRAIIRFDLSSDEVSERTLVEAWVPQPWAEGRGAPVTLEEFVGEVWAFEPALLFDVLPSGGVVFADSSAYAVKLTDRSGMVTRIVRRPIPPLRATEAIKRAERDRRLEEQAWNRRTTSGGGGEPTAEMEALDRAMAAARRAAVENMQFFPEVPVIAALRATWDGTLWVQRSAEPGSSESGAIDVISPDGRYIGTFPRGSLAMPDAFGPDGLTAFIETDELDVPVITVRRLPVEVRQSP